jgi:RNA polymerase sigma-70 factor (ECF subfamily)
VTLADEMQIRAVYVAHGAELYGFALRALGDRGLAEEATQETFVRAWRSASTFDAERGSLRAWLFGIARHVIIDLVRRRSVRPVVVGEIPESTPSDDTAFDRAMESWQIEEALRRIPPDQRRALVEVYYRDRPYAEVAAELHIPEGTMKSRVYHGLRALRRALEEMGWTDDS